MHAYPFYDVVFGYTNTNNAVASGKFYTLPVKLSMLADNITVLRNKRPHTNMNK